MNNFPTKGSDIYYSLGILQIRWSNADFLNIYPIIKWEYQWWCKNEWSRQWWQKFSTNFATFLVKKYHLKYSHRNTKTKRVHEIKLIYQRKIISRLILSPKCDFFAKIGQNSPNKAFFVQLNAMREFLPFLPYK